MKNPLVNIPNCITCLNLVSGCLAIVMAFNLSSSICGLYGREWVYIFIGAAAVFDFCDGFAARLLHAYSPMGKELDSLSDLVSFGVAPGMLMFCTMQSLGTSALWSAAALLIPVCGALRLAKFNVDDSQTTTFKGLPIPANAIFWIGFSAWIEQYNYPGPWVMCAVILIISLAMICNVRMFSLKFKNLQFYPNVRRYVIVFAAIVFVVFYGVSGLAWTIVLYMLISLFGRKNANDEE